MTDTKSSLLFTFIHRTSNTGLFCDPQLLISSLSVNFHLTSVNLKKMATILSVNDISPKWGSHCFIAPNATIVGDVQMGDQCSVWFNAVIRGDVNYIKMGNKVNIQDGAVIHCTYQKNATNIGNNVSIGHNAIVHGCTVHDNVLIGMGAIVMDRCVVNSNSIIAAGAVVLEGTIVEEKSIYAGVPAKKVKDISSEMISGEIDRIANNYVKYSSWFENYNDAEK
jgi:carbonic anhydrase/acetyltransferase-like protein (isoleucine patch superfamily)